TGDATPEVRALRGILRRRDGCRCWRRGYAATTRSRTANRGSRGRRDVRVIGLAAKVRIQNRGAPALPGSSTQEGQEIEMRRVFRRQELRILDGIPRGSREFHGRLSARGLRGPPPSCELPGGYESIH